MRFVRYQYRNQPPRFGWVIEDRLGPLEGTPFTEFRRMEADLPVEKVQLLAPVEPGKIIGINGNYIGYTKNAGKEKPDIPVISLKPPSAICGHGQEIVIPAQSQQVNHQAELAVVISKTGRWIPIEKAQDYVFGFTIGNDVFAADIIEQDGYPVRAKSFDTFCPLGPWIETEFDAADALITCHVNKEMRQMASTRDMAFSVRQLIVFVSSIMTLNRGDIILTGTPAGGGILSPGDKVEIAIEGLGKLVNPVVKARFP